MISHAIELARTKPFRPTAFIDDIFIYGETIWVIPEAWQTQCIEHRFVRGRMGAEHTQ